jgi:peptide-methionine (S)-S-oxide reductase
MNEKNFAVFGGGCFWCTEAVFKMMRGVSSVLPGYAGGTVANPTYAQVSEGTTGHAEVVQIEYDPTLVSYKNLLTVFFGSHDSTTLNQQGADIGTQYRSVIFYTTPEQEAEAESFIKDMNESNSAGAPVITQVEPLDTFYVAEDYHKDYYTNHQNAGYCQVVINPKLEKVQKQFADLLALQQVQDK